MVNHSAWNNALITGKHMVAAEERGFALIHDAAEAGNVAGMYMAGLCYQSGMGVEQNEELAGYWLNMVSEAIRNEKTNKLLEDFLHTML